MFDKSLLARHVLRAMTVAQKGGLRVTLDDLAADLGVRRNDVRSAVSALHRQGLVDVLRMHVTLAGFAIGSALNPLPALPSLRAAVRLAA